MPLKEFEVKNLGPIKFAKMEDMSSIVILTGPNGVGKSRFLERLKDEVNIEEKGKAVLEDRPFFSIYVPNRLMDLESEFEQIIAYIFKKFGGSGLDGVVIESAYDHFRRLVKNLLPEFEFINAEKDKEGNFCRMYFKNKMKTVVEFSQLSLGEQWIMQMLFPYIERRIRNEFIKIKKEEIPYLYKNLIFLIDTPEVYLQPALQRNLLKYLRESVKTAESKGEQLQFILATHSTVIINEALPGELYIMLFPEFEGQNQITKITDNNKYLLEAL